VVNGVAGVDGAGVFIATGITFLETWAERDPAAVWRIAVCACLFAAVRAAVLAGRTRCGVPVGFGMNASRYLVSFNFMWR
jgi:hypothetical protein